MKNKLNAFATSCFRVMLNIKRLDHVSNAQIYNMTKTQPLINKVKQRQLGFIGHVLRMPAEEPARTYALYVPTHGKRQPRTAEDQLPDLHPEPAGGHRR